MIDNQALPKIEWAYCPVHYCWEMVALIIWDILAPFFFFFLTIGGSEDASPIFIHVRV